MLRGRRAKGVVPGSTKPGQFLGEENWRVDGSETKTQPTYSATCSNRKVEGVVGSKVLGLQYGDSARMKGEALLLNVWRERSTN